MPLSLHTDTSSPVATFPIGNIIFLGRGGGGSTGARKGGARLTLGATREREREKEKEREDTKAGRT